MSQTIGQGNYELCGVYMNRAIFLWIVAMAFYAGIVSYSDTLLISIGQDPKTSRYTRQFLVYYVPGLFLWGLCDLYRRYLGCFKKTFLPMMSYFIATSSHPFWCHLFVDHMELRLYGVAFAGLATNGVNFALIMVFLLFDKEMVDALVAPDQRIFTDLGSYLMQSVPNTIILFIDYWAWEQMTLATGYLGIVSQAAQVVMIYLLSMSFTAILGLQSPCGTLIGNQIGNANVIQARAYLKIAVYFLVLVILLQIFLFEFYKREIIALFTQDAKLVEELHRVYHMFLICMVPDCVRGMFKGVLRGLGLQNRTVHFHFIFQGIGMSLLILYFGFVCEGTKGLFGVWLANQLTGSLIALSFIFTVFRWDWHGISREAVKRIAEESKNAGCLQLNQMIADNDAKV